MNLGLIEYLESKNFEVEEIIRFQKNFLNREDDGIIRKMDTIYKIFGYANLNELEKSDIDLIKVAYCWLGTGVISDAANRKVGISYNNPERIYLRNLYLNSGINYNKSPISYRALTMGEAEFQNDYRGPIKENGKEFYPTYENLIYIYCKGNTIEEKQKYLDELLNNLSIKWYLSCLKKEKEKNKEDQGYGFI